MEPAEIDAVVKAYAESCPVATLQVGSQILRYLTPNLTCLARAQTLATKEPHTIAWLNSMPEGSVYLDVGANVGMYAVYAGVARKARVYAFEPEAQNYALLCLNLSLNALMAGAWCAALSDEARFDRLYLSTLMAGGSCHSFGENVDPYLKPSGARFAQGSYATTIDAMVEGGAIEVPGYIKIDVDGFEHKVIKGAAVTLKNPAVRSLLIEINPHLEEHRWIIDHLSVLGFAYDPNQFAGAARKGGFFKGVGEYVFRR